jgi:hypothetical protein
MGTPSTPTFRQIVLGEERRSLTIDEQLSLLAARQDFLKPYLNYLPWKSLDTSVRFLNVYKYSGTWTLSNQSFRGLRLNLTEGLELGTQGIFSEISTNQDRTHQFVIGFTRNGEWVKCGVDCIHDGPQKLKPFHILLEHFNLREWLESYPYVQSSFRFKVLWELLTDLVTTWWRERKRRYEQAELVFERIRAENYLLGHGSFIDLDLMEQKERIQR